MGGSLALALASVSIALRRSPLQPVRPAAAAPLAHRLSTVRNAASINVLDEGRVVERGTHEELLALDGIYANLWRVQTGEAVTGGSVAD